MSPKLSRYEPLQKFRDHWKDGDWSAWLDVGRVQINLFQMRNEQASLKTSGMHPVQIRSNRIQVVDQLSEEKCKFTKDCFQRWCRKWVKSAAVSGGSLTLQYEHQFVELTNKWWHSGIQSLSRISLRRWAHMLLNASGVPKTSEFRKTRNSNSD